MPARLRNCLRSRPKGIVSDKDMTASIPMPLQPLPPKFYTFLLAPANCRIFAVFARNISRHCMGLLTTLETTNVVAQGRLGGIGYELITQGKTSKQSYATARVA